MQGQEYVGARANVCAWVFECVDVWMCACVLCGRGVCGCVLCVGVVYVGVLVSCGCVWLCTALGGAVESVCTHHNKYFIRSAHPQGRLGETTLLETADSTLTSGVADMPTDNAAKIHTIVPDEPPHRCCPCPNRSERTRGATAGQTMGLRGLGRQRPPVEAPHHVVDHRGKAVRQREAGPVLGHTQHRTPMPLW